MFFCSSLQLSVLMLYSASVSGRVAPVAHRACLLVCLCLFYVHLLVFVFMHVFPLLSFAVPSRQVILVLCARSCLLIGVLVFVFSALARACCHARVSLDQIQ